MCDGGACMRTYRLLVNGNTAAAPHQQPRQFGVEDDKAQRERAPVPAQDVTKKYGGKGETHADAAAAKCHVSSRRRALARTICCPSGEAKPLPAATRRSVPSNLIRRRDLAEMPVLSRASTTLASAMRSTSMPSQPLPKSLRRSAGASAVWPKSLPMQLVKLHTGSAWL